MTIAVGDILFIGRTLESTDFKVDEGHTKFEVLKSEYSWNAERGEQVVEVELKPLN